LQAVPENTTDLKDKIQDMEKKVKKMASAMKKEYNHVN